MTESEILLTLGALFLAGLAADLAGRFSGVPRVTLLLLVGIAIGPSGFSLLPTAFVEDWFPLLTYVALSMIGFLLGQKLTLQQLREGGGVVLGVSIGKAVGATLIVALALMLLGVDLPFALLLGGIAAATDPAATFDVVRESGIEGKFTDTLLEVVAIDDAWGLLLFAILMATAAGMLDPGNVGATLWGGSLEIGGSLLLGLVLGVPMAYLTGRIRAGEPTQAEALGLVLLCSGAAIALDLSPILSSMVMGSTVASLASHHNQPFDVIEGFEWPFMILFFILIGASLDLGGLGHLGWIGATYIIARALGTWLGCGIGAHLTHASHDIKRWMGLALLPQAGVAMGMALLASQRFPEFADDLLTIVIASTIILEISAPVLTQRVLARVGGSAVP
ncbi:MAG: cation:proton antiporter [Pseudomonadales bacterium]